MHFITFLTLPVYDVSFTVSHGEGRAYNHFPKKLCGNYCLGPKWQLSIVPKYLSLRNAQERLEIQLWLSTRFRLHKMEGFFVLEHSFKQGSSIMLMRSSTEKLMLQMPKIEAWKQIPNKSALLVAQENGITTYRTNRHALNALLLQGFFDHQLQMSRMVN